MQVFPFFPSFHLILLQSASYLSVGGAGRGQGRIKLVETWGGGWGVVPQGDLGQELPAGFLSSEKWEGLEKRAVWGRSQVRSWGGSALIYLVTSPALLP